MTKNEDLEDIIESVKKYVCCHSEACDYGIGHINPRKDVIAKFGGKIAMKGLVNNNRSSLVFIGMKNKKNVGDIAANEDLDLIQPLPILTFDDTKSIDMVIEKLYNLKTEMINKRDNK